MLLLKQGEEKKELLSTASLDGSIRLWDVTQSPPRERNVLRGHERGVTCLAFSSEHKLLFSAGLVRRPPSLEPHGAQAAAAAHARLLTGAGPRAARLEPALGDGHLHAARARRADRGARGDGAHRAAPLHRHERRPIRVGHAGARADAGAQGLAADKRERLGPRVAAAAPPGELLAARLSRPAHPPPRASAFPPRNPRRCSWRRAGSFASKAPRRRTYG